MSDPTTSSLSIDAAHRTRRSRIPLVWIVPTVAAVLGAWIGVHALLERGPTIEVTFVDAEGIEAGKTKLRYHSVDVGVVTKVALAADHQSASVSIVTTADATPLFLDGSRIWIVRPRLGASGISGLGTLLSGAYLGMDVGKSSIPQRQFSGLEVPPVIGGGAKGREFVLDGSDLGSLAVSSPVYFHHLEVGRISSVALSPNGGAVTATAFVDAPYDRFVTATSRFWHASGVDVEISGSGLQIHTESISTIVAGGIAFDTPAGEESAGEALENSHFRLAPNQAVALKPVDHVIESYVLNFKESVRGLSRGSSVNFGGVDIGEVTSLNVEYQRESERFIFPVSINIFPDRFRARFSAGGGRPDVQAYELVSRMISRGLRAQLRTANLLTGQQYIALDFFPTAAKVIAHPEATPMPLPTVPGNLIEIEDALVHISRKLDHMPLERIGGDLAGSLASFKETLGAATATLKDLDGSLMPAAHAALEQATHTLAQAQDTLTSDAPLQSDLHTTLDSISQAADALRHLADYLDAHPEALIRGKARDAR